MKKLTLIAISLISCSLLSGCLETKQSDKIGNIVKFGKEGVFCKTYEGELLRGGINNGTGSIGSSFSFTVESDELAKKVEALMNSGKEVKIHFKTEMFSFCRSDSESTFLTDIEVFNPDSNNPAPIENNNKVNNNSDLDTKDIIDKIVTQNNTILQQNNDLIEVLKKK